MIIDFEDHIEGQMSDCNSKNWFHWTSTPRGSLKLSYFDEDALPESSVFKRDTLRRVSIFTMLTYDPQGVIFRTYDLLIFDFSIFGVFKIKRKTADKYNLRIKFCISKCVAVSRESMRCFDQSVSTLWTLQS